MPRLIIKSYSRRSIPLGRRDHEALNVNDRLRISRTTLRMRGLRSMLPVFHDIPIARRLILPMMVSEFVELLRIVVVEVPDRPPRQIYAPMSFATMEGHLRSIGIDVSERYRFQSIDTLNRFKAAFQFPEGNDD